MSSQVRLTPWPFEVGEVVTLTWLRSPQKTGPQDQWQLAAVFRPKKGKQQEMLLDWAMLPLLSLGQRYRDGVPIPNDFESAPSRLDLSKADVPQVMAARRVLPPDVYRLHVQENWQELCWVWTLPGTKAVRVVVPVLTLLRGLFAQGSFLTTGLLNPLTLDTVARHEVDGTVLRLHFSASFRFPATAWERDALLTRLARLLCDPFFGAAYRSVALARAQAAHGPLKCDLPELSALWDVRLISRKNILLVQEVLWAEPLEELPVERIEYDHPLYPRRAVPLPRQKTTRLVRTPRGFAVDTRGPAAKVPKVRSELSAPPAALIEPTVPKIANIGREEQGASGAPVKPWMGGGERLVSLAGTGPNANAPQAGVRPGRVDQAPLDSEDGGWQAVEEWAQPQEDGLNAFREMLTIFGRTYPQVNVVFRLGPKLLAGSERTFERPYAVVALALEDKLPVWLVEFAKRPERPLSTLVLRGETCAEWDAFEDVLTRVLTKGLDRKEWWNLIKLAETEASTGASIRRLLHTSGKAERWAERVFALLAAK